MLIQKSLTIKGSRNMTCKKLQPTDIGGISILESKKISKKKINGS